MVHFCTAHQNVMLLHVFFRQCHTIIWKDSLEVNSKKVLKILNWLFCVISLQFPIEWIFCCREFLYHINIHFYELFLNEIKSFILNFSSFSLTLRLAGVSSEGSKEKEREWLQTHIKSENHNQLRKEEKKVSIVETFLSSHGEEILTFFSCESNKLLSLRPLMITFSPRKTMQKLLNFHFIWCD
jgi:hypothetical protein